MTSDVVAFLVAAAALLAAPGPTNALLAAAGAALGWPASARLVPAALAGYMATIATLALVVGPELAGRPEALAALRAAAAVWLAFAAFRLWRAAPDGGALASALRPWRACLTSALNPKALILSLGLIDHAADPRVAAGLIGALAALIAATGLIWTGAGAALSRRRHAGVSFFVISRASAIAIALFAVLVLAQAGRAALFPPA